MPQSLIAKSRRWCSESRIEKTKDGTGGSSGLISLDSIAELEKLKQEYFYSAEHASIRGLSGGPFLFLQHNGRAIEISTNGQSWWMEVWEKSDDEDAQPVTEFSNVTRDTVIAKTYEWLKIN